jgi:hypothetical protein
MHPHGEMCAGVYQPDAQGGSGRLAARRVSMERCPASFVRRNAVNAPVSGTFDRHSLTIRANDDGKVLTPSADALVQHQRRT